MTRERLPGWTPIPRGLSTAEAYRFIETNFELLYNAVAEDFRSSDAKPSDQHTQREPAEDATSGTAGPGPAPD